MTPHQEYIRRATDAAFLPLTPLHHRVMDNLFADFRDGFCSDDVYLKHLDDLAIVNNPAIAGNPNRVKLIVIRTLDSLVAVGMLKDLVSDQRRFSLSWHPSS